MDEPLYIVAENGPTARAAALDLGLPPTPGRHWRYVSSEVMLRGRQKARVHYVPGWDVHPYAAAIKHNLDRVSDLEVV